MKDRNHVRADVDNFDALCGRLAESDLVYWREQIRRLRELSELALLPPWDERWAGHTLAKVDEEITDIRFELADEFIFILDDAKPLLPDN